MEAIDVANVAIKEFFNCLGNKGIDPQKVKEEFLVNVLGFIVKKVFTLISEQPNLPEQILIAKAKLIGIEEGVAFMSFLAAQN